MSNQGKDPRIEATLKKQLQIRGLDNFDVVDLVPIPARVDRMVRIRTLEEVLDDFDSNATGDAINYLIQIRPKKSHAADEVPVQTPSPMVAIPGEPAISLLSQPPQPTAEGVYLPDGKLNAPFLAHNAEILFQAGDYALARNIYLTLLQTGERSALAHYWIARCYEAEGKLEGSIQHFESSIAYDAQPESYQHYATVLIQMKKDHQAAEVLERALTLKGLSQSVRFEIHKACGNCWTRINQSEFAERNYKKALEIDPGADDIQANLGALHLQVGRISEARKCFQDAVASNGRSEKAWMGLGSCFISEGDKRQAHDCFAKSLEINLNNATAIYYLVKCAYELKSYATAARLVEEYVDIAPVNANLLYSLAGLQFHLGRMEDARATTKRAIGLQPNHSGAVELLKMIDQIS